MDGVLLWFTVLQSIPKVKGTQKCTPRAGDSSDTKTLSQQSIQSMNDIRRLSFTGQKALKHNST